MSIHRWLKYSLIKGSNEALTCPVAQNLTNLYLIQAWFSWRRTENSRANHFFLYQVQGKSIINFLSNCFLCESPSDFFIILRFPTFDLSNKELENFSILDIFLKIEFDHLRMSKMRQKFTEKCLVNSLRGIWGRS